MLALSLNLLDGNLFLGHMSLASSLKTGQTRVLKHWCFDESQAPLLTGISQLLTAQRHVNERIDCVDPGEGLSGAGIKAVAPARYGTAKEEDGEKAKC